MLLRAHWGLMCIGVVSPTTTVLCSPQQRNCGRLITDTGSKFVTDETQTPISFFGWKIDQNAIQPRTATQLQSRERPNDHEPGGSMLCYSDTAHPRSRHQDPGKCGRSHTRPDSWNLYLFVSSEVNSSSLQLLSSLCFIMALISLIKA